MACRCARVKGQIAKAKMSTLARMSAKKIGRAKSLRRVREARARARETRMFFAMRKRPDFWRVELRVLVRRAMSGAMVHGWKFLTERGSREEADCCETRGRVMSDVQMGKIKASMQAAWMAGDFGMIAKTIARGAERFVAALGVTPGMQVLDVATGTGNLAIPLARAGATVTGVDIAANLLEQARERAQGEGLEIEFDEGDAEALPYADASFDMAVSMFGAMFAPRPTMVAAELARVLKVGGKLAMANWNPASFTGRMFGVGSRHAPGPLGVPAPVLWGDEATVHARLTPYFGEIRMELVPVKFDLPMPPAEVVEFFRMYFGPTQMAFARLDSAGQTRLRGDLEALWTGANVSDDPTRHTLVMNEFLKVTAVRV